MTGDVIKSFLVGLGFEVDDASLSKFNKAIAGATLKVAALYGAIQLTSAGIAKSLSSISEGFEQIGYEYKILAPAINKALILRQELFKAYSRAGINLTQTVVAAARLNLSLTKTRYALEAVYRSVGSRFFGILTKQSDIFRQQIYANMPRIQAILESVIHFIFKMLEATIALGQRLWSILSRVYDLFVKLDKATDGWSTRIIAAVAAWKLLNLGFLATPLGMLLAGFVALLALWDDFKTFKEGGQSLINWGSQTTQIMVGLAAAIAAVAAAVYTVRLAMQAYAITQAAVNAVMLLNPVGLILVGILALTAALTALDAKWRIFGGNLSGFFSGVGARILEFAGGTNTIANLKNGPGGVPLANPIGNTAQNSQTNQHVRQQTNINVMGSADAAAVGKAVSGEQGKVNFDMARNFRSAVSQ